MVDGVIDEPDLTIGKQTVTSALLAAGNARRMLAWVDSELNVVPEQVSRFGPGHIEVTAFRHLERIDQFIGNVAPRRGMLLRPDRRGTNYRHIIGETMLPRVI